MADFVRVASVDDLKPGTVTTVKVGATEVALAHVDGGFFALSNICLHVGGPLGEGELDGHELTCPWHGWTYDVRDGQCTLNPNAKVGCYSVRVEDGAVLVAVD